MAGSELKADLWVNEYITPWDIYSHGVSQILAYKKTAFQEAWCRPSRSEPKGGEGVADALHSVGANKALAEAVEPLLKGALQLKLPLQLGVLHGPLIEHARDRPQAGRASEHGTSERADHVSGAGELASALMAHAEFACRNAGEASSGNAGKGLGGHVFCEEAKALQWTGVVTGNGCGIEAGEGGVQAEATEGFTAAARQAVTTEVLQKGAGHAHLAHGLSP